MSAGRAPGREEGGGKEERWREGFWCLCELIREAKWCNGMLSLNHACLSNGKQIREVKQEVIPK